MIKFILYEGNSIFLIFLHTHLHCPRYQESLHCLIYLLVFSYMSITTLITNHCKLLTPSMCTRPWTWKVYVTNDIFFWFKIAFKMQITLFGLDFIFLELKLRDSYFIIHALPFFIHQKNANGTKWIGDTAILLDLSFLSWLFLCVFLFSQGFVREFLFDRHPKRNWRVDESDLFVRFQSCLNNNARGNNTQNKVFK